MVNKSIVFVVVSAMLAGCASIMSPSEYSIAVSSNVKNAKVTIYNRDKEVGVVTAPTEVRLSPKAGFYVPAKYRFVFEKEGFSIDEIAMDADFNWWFASNFITWGFVVGVFLDPATGAMWKLNETSVVGSLKPLAGQGEHIEVQREENVPSWIFQGGDGTDSRGNAGRSSQSIEIEQIPL